MDTITGTIQIWVDYFADAFSSAVEFLGRLPQMLGFLHQLFRLIPAEIRGFALVSVSLSVLLMFVSFIRTDTAGG